MESASKVSKDSLKYFPSNYEDSRARFLKLCELYQAKDSRSEHQSFQLPDDSSLFVDSLYIPAREKTESLLVLTSGVHGAEAFSGSAIQEMFLNEILSEQDRKNIGVLLIHSINPYGFKYLRRVSGHNVDMNRNFETNPKHFTHQNDNYRLIQKTLNRTEPVGHLSLCKNIISAIKIVSQLGLAKTNQAVGQGQYQNEKGVMFGGFVFEPQVAFVKEVFLKASASYPKIILLDLHTGLGNKNELYLIGSDMGSQQSKDWARFLFSTDSKNHRISTEHDSGFYVTYGDMTEFIIKLSGPKLVASATAEFGTVGNDIFAKIRTLFNLINENQSHHYGAKNPQKIKDEFMEIFYPKSLDWRMSVLIKNDFLLRQVLQRLQPLK